MSHGKGDIISAIKEHIDIPDYLESCGYHVRKHGSKGKLTLKEHDSFVYDPERKRFYWNSRDLEGDIVDLYGYLNNCDFDAALRALRAMLPARTYQASRPSTSAVLRPSVTKSAPFSPPKSAPQNLKYVYALSALPSQFLESSYLRCCGRASQAIFDPIKAAPGFHWGRLYIEVTR